ncbi:uncharacterized protein N7518_000278 [Penicillium psychrosexuale]|uniref:uncharacterized protein n=1 Tax=Penicillium psychrosexuale TaxID=1002107 RepID=UPI00254539C0|nr:uncharacterized protein N7518_000278 [Penicillium psychrosexuale]KAJ5803975.1 hypothetical protein N7518_000278 [Penicillium psychrosexuale]
MPSITATGDFGPAPAGVDLAKNQTGNLLGAVIPVAVFGTIAVILRLVAPMKNKEARKLALDDYLIVAALIFSWGTAISCFINFLGIPYGNGYHLQSLNKAEFITVWKILFAYVMIYATAITFTKSSIVFFYGRIFNFRWSLGFCMFLVLGYWVTIIVTVAVACRPLPYFWLAYTDPTAVGVCIDVPKFFFGNGIGAMLIDVIILCMPMPTIYKLQMQSSQKLAVVGILLLGSLYVLLLSYYNIIRANQAQCLRRKYLPDHRPSEQHPRNRRYVDYGTGLYLVVRGTFRWDHLRVPPYVRAILSSMVVQGSDRALIKQPQHSKWRECICFCFDDLAPETPIQKATHGLIIQHQ